MRGRGSTLFQRTGLTLLAGLLLFLLFGILVTRIYLLQPVTERAAEELAALLELSAKVWVELPPWTRDDYARELGERHGLHIALAEGELQHTRSRREYLDYLEAALQRRFEKDLHVLDDEAHPGWYWVDLPVSERVLRLGFEVDRLRTNIPQVVILIGSAGTLFILISSLLLVRRVTRPLSDLSAAVQRLGRGGTVRAVPETGPRELSALARRINETEKEIRGLLENRTTLLAGISHDLRTPIARMRLDLELLRDDIDGDSFEGMGRDLDEMETLISRTLELAHGLERQEAFSAHLPEFLVALAEDFRRSGMQVETRMPDSCTLKIPPNVLRRVLSNLLDNAMRYGGGHPVVLGADCSDEAAACVYVRDRGPGIPAEQRDKVQLPFHRLEDSRNKATGGSGLGLAVVRQLCVAHGWGFELDEAPGGGVEARVLIPRDAA